MSNGMLARVRPLFGLSVFIALLLSGCSNCGSCGLPGAGGGGAAATGPGDTQPPKVQSSTPNCPDTCVQAGQILSVVFSEPMDAATINNSTVQLTGPGGIAVAGAVSYSGVTAVFTPAEPLAGGTVYRLTVTAGAHDAAGNALSPAYTCQFTTAPATDTVAPTVSATDPPCSSTGAATNRKLSITFSEAMDASSISSTTLRLSGPGGAVAGSVSYSGVTAIFTPAAPLAPSASYAMNVTTGARDAAGNPLAAAFLCGFTTGSAADAAPPSVSFVNPVCGSADVALDTAILITFSETMDPASINGASVSVSGPGGAIAGAVSYVARTATFTPAALLPASSQITVSVSTAAADLAGNLLAAPLVCSFRTGVATDTATPLVTASAPMCNAIDVPVNHAIAVRFSEGMNPRTVTTSTMTVTGPGCAVAGTVICDSCVNATFTPINPLAPATPFTLRISGAAQDLAGNAMGADFVCGFTTGATSDTTPPVLASTQPASGATGVCPSQQIRASFSETMDPVTLSTGSFRVTGPGGTPIAGLVSYDITTLVATFTPNADLPAAASITAAITADAHDLAGLPLAAGATANPWSFITGAQPCAPAPRRN